MEFGLLGKKLNKNLLVSSTFFCLVPLSCLVSKIVGRVELGANDSKLRQVDAIN